MRPGTILLTHPLEVAIARNKSITKWNVLALVIVLAGLVITLSLDQFWLYTWSESGVQFPIGGQYEIELPAGRSLVYYESYESVPAGPVTLQIFSATGERTRVGPPRNEDNRESYRVRLTGLSGKAFWELDVLEGGPYQIMATNESVLSDSDIPADDRVVFFKSPNSLRGATRIQKMIRISGATITAVPTIVCYLLHWGVLGRIRREEGPPEDDLESETHLI